MGKRLSLMKFCYISFMIQIIIAMPITFATAGTTLLNNEETSGIIETQTARINETANTSIVTNETLQNLKASNPITYFVEGFFNMVYYINIMGNLAWSLVATSQSLGFMISFYAASTGGTVGAILGIFGLIYLAWQVAIVVKFILAILGRG